MPDYILDALILGVCKQTDQTAKPAQPLILLPISSPHDRKEN